jgi:hypothetical protein
MDKVEGLRVYDTTLKSRTPFLMHRFPIENGSEGNSTTITKDMTVEQQAEAVAFRTEDGELFIPAEHFEGSFRGGARFHKIGVRAAWPLAGAAVHVVQRELRLGKKLKYAIDSRRVVIKKTGGSIIRHRPMISNWELSFQIELDTSIYSDSLFRKIIVDAGLRAGIGDFRPDCSGSFGRYDVVHLKAR